MRETYCVARGIAYLIDLHVFVPYLLWSLIIHRNGLLRGFQVFHSCAKLCDRQVQYPPTPCSACVGRMYTPLMM